jgi:hypothetical protein
MTKINGVELIETMAGDPGYLQVTAALIDAGCNYFFSKRGMSSGAAHNPYKPKRFPCGRKRPEGPRIARIKRTDLSHAHRSRLSERKETE